MLGDSAHDQGPHQVPEKWSAGWTAGVGRPPKRASAPSPAAHLAELDLHEDVVLPPTAPLHTPGVLGSVGAEASGRGAPGAHEANSCPGRGTGDKLTQGDPLPHALPSQRAFSLRQETLSALGVDKERKN